MPFHFALIRPLAPGPMWHSTHARFECGARLNASHSGCIAVWQVAPQNCGESMYSSTLCPASAKSPMFATVPTATKRMRLRAEGSLNAASNAACSASFDPSCWRLRSTRKPMGMSKRPIANASGSRTTTNRLRYGFTFEVENPITSSRMMPKPEIVVMIDPSRVIQFAHRRGSSDVKRKRHLASRELPPANRLLLQRADVGHQRIDRRRIELVLVAFHDRVALLGAVLDGLLDLRIRLLLPG